MNDELAALLEASRSVEITPEHREEQRRTFAFGNTHFENSLITRKMVDEQAEKLDREEAAKGRPA